MRPARQVLKGIAASPGVAVGNVCVFDREHIHVPRRHVGDDQLDHEEKRLHDAIESAREELDEVRHRLGDGAETKLLLDSHDLMMRDELLIDGAVAALRRDNLNAEWALSKTVGELTRRLKGAGEDYLRERADDIDHVGERILRHLTGTQVALPPLTSESVLIAYDLGPADAAQLIKAQAAGICIDLGSASSHTAILARALEIPAVVGISNLSSLVGDGDPIIVDALHGEVILEPEEAEAVTARERGERYRVFTRKLREHAGRTAQTSDGTRVRLDANVELPAEAAVAVQEGADGIGLYRTEFLYLDRKVPPSEEEQTRVYTDVMQVMAPRPVVFRTFDIGGDSLHGHSEPTLNPALGLRAVRLGFQRPDLLKTQIRALLRSRMTGDVRIMFPLVTAVEEIRRARAMVEEARAELEQEGLSPGAVPVGMMIEVPSAAMMADVFAREVDFFSVGTNDLVQYTLAIDRTNPKVAYLASPLHPGVLRLLARTAEAASAANIELNMCGAMAADPLALPVVIGLGYESVSTSVAYLPLVRAAIEAIDLPTARELAGRALQAATVDEVRALVIGTFRNALGELWQEQGLELE